MLGPHGLRVVRVSRVIFLDSSCDGLSITGKWFLVQLETRLPPVQGMLEFRPRLP